MYYLIRAVRIIYINIMVILSRNSIMLGGRIINEGGRNSVELYSMYDIGVESIWYKVY